MAKKPTPRATPRAAPRPTPPVASLHGTNNSPSPGLKFRLPRDWAFSWFPMGAGSATAPYRAFLLAHLIKLVEHFEHFSVHGADWDDDDPAERQRFRDAALLVRAACVLIKGTGVDVGGAVDAARTALDRVPSLAVEAPVDDGTGRVVELGAYDRQLVRTDALDALVADVAQVVREFYTDQKLSGRVAALILGRLHADAGLLHVRERVPTPSALPKKMPRHVGGHMEAAQILLEKAVSNVIEGERSHLASLALRASGPKPAQPGEPAWDQLAESTIGGAIVALGGKNEDVRNLFAYRQKRGSRA
jgi:hypothetical protein